MPSKMKKPKTVKSDGCFEFGCWGVITVLGLTKIMRYVYAFVSPVILSAKFRFELCLSSNNY